MKKKKGSVLILTLVVVLLLTLLGTSLFTMSVSNYKTEVTNDSINKLNMMAESGIEIALTKANSPSGLVKFGGFKSDDGIITCNVKFIPGETDKAVIESTAIDDKNSRTIRVKIIKKPEKPAGRAPTDNLFFIDGAVSNGNFNCGSADGPVYVNGDFYMSSGSSIKGKLISTGNITLTGGSSSTNGIVSFGNVNLDGGGIINGDALVKGNLYFGGGTKINGNVQSDGNLIMPQGNIQNNATIGRNATFDGGANKIGGKLYYQGTATSNNGGTTLANYVPLGAVKTTTYTPVNLSSYESPILPDIAVPTITENSQMYNTVVLNNNTINSSGSLSSSLFNTVNYGSTITIDTSSDDVSLLVNNFNFDSKNGLDFEVTGSHNLYIYLKGNSASFTVGSNQFIGMKKHSVPSQVYIIGDGNQKVAISNCELDAYIYIPNGSFSASGGAPAKYMFQGSCVTKSVSIQSNISVNYLTQDIENTPLAVLKGGQSSSGSGNWIVDKWDN